MGTARKEDRVRAKNVEGETQRRTDESADGRTEYVKERQKKGGIKDEIKTSAKETKEGLAYGRKDDKAWMKKGQKDGHAEERNSTCMVQQGGHGRPVDGLQDILHFPWQCTVNEGQQGEGRTMEGGPWWKADGGRKKTCTLPLSRLLRSSKNRLLG
jgi:hypothetical protein